MNSVPCSGTLSKHWSKHILLSRSYKIDNNSIDQITVRLMKMKKNIYIYI